MHSGSTDPENHGKGTAQELQPGGGGSTKAIHLLPMRERASPWRAAQKPGRSARVLGEAGRTCHALCLRSQDKLSRMKTLVLYAS